MIDDSAKTKAQLLEEVQTLRSRLVEFKVEPADSIQPRRPPTLDLAHDDAAEIEHIYRTAPVGLCLVDRDLCYVRINERLAAINGRPISEHLGRKVQDAIPNIAPQVEPIYRQVIETGEPVLDHEVHGTTPASSDEEGCWVVSYHPVKSPDGTVVGVSCVVQDITERKRIEAALRGSERQSREQLAELEALYKTAPLGLCHMDTDLRYLRCNEKLAEINGIPAADHIGRTFREIVPQIADAMEPVYRKVIQSGEPVMNVVASGATPADPKTTRHFSACYYPVKSEDGLIQGVSSIVEDITERTVAEEQIQADNAVLETVTHVHRDFLADADPSVSFDRMLTLLKEVTASEYGFIGEVLRQPGGEPYLKTHAITNIAWSDETSAFYEQSAPTGMEFYNLNTLFGAVMTTSAPVIANDAAHDPRKGGLPPGHPALRAVLGLPFFHGDELIGMVGLANRIGGYDEQVLETLTPILASCSSLVHAYRLETDRKRAEDALREAEMMNRSLLEGSPVCNKIIDLDSQLLYMSTAGQKQLKIPDVTPYYGCTYPPDFFPESTQTSLIEHLERAKTGETTSLECRALDIEGCEVWYHTTFVPARDDEGRIKYIIATSVNITERKRAEEDRRRLHDELAQRSQVGTLGEMAATLAHELNQPLAAIGNYAAGSLNLLQAKDADSPQVREALEHIARLTRRAGEIIRQIRSLVRNEPNKFSTPPNDLIREVVELVEFGAHAKAVKIELELDDELPMVLVDRVQIQQVIVNLVQNALDAMAGIDPRAAKLVIQTRATPVGNVQVAVSDMGSGLPGGSDERVFEPFFTTKPDGLGLGLGISRSIIEAHGGRLWSRPQNKGATFLFTLPVAAVATTSPQPSSDK